MTQIAPTDTPDRQEHRQEQEQEKVAPVAPPVRHHRREESKEEQELKAVIDQVMSGDETKQESDELPPVQVTPILKKVGSSSSSSKSKLRTGEHLKPFPLAPLPFASLRVHQPAPALLSSGTRNSSSHLQLVALDPARSVIRSDILLKMKMEFIKNGCGRPSQEEIEREKEASKKRSARERADEEEERKKNHKRQKMLPIVPLQSLLTLEKQLSRESNSEDESRPSSRSSYGSSSIGSRSSASSTTSSMARELAAVALARHLVDWTEDLGCTFVSDDEEEEMEEAELEAAMRKELARTQPMDCGDSLPISHPVLQPAYTSSASELIALTTEYSPMQQEDLVFGEEHEEESSDGADSDAPTPSLDPGQLTRCTTLERQESVNPFIVVPQDDQSHPSDEMMLLMNEPFLFSPMATNYLSPKTSPFLTYVSPPPVATGPTQLQLDGTAPLASTFTSSGQQMISLIQHQPNEIWI